MAPVRMLPARRAFAAASLLALPALGPARAWAQAAPPTPARVAASAARAPIDSAALHATLQRTLDSLRALGRAPGLSAAVTLPDGRSIAVASGLADSARAEPLTPSHRLLAGSVGKTFFAALALELIASGRVSLDARVATVLGDRPWYGRLPNGADITVRQLMTHTSGLVRYEFQPAFTAALRADPQREWRVDEQLAYVFDQPAPFAAGQGWEYSDTNYLVLALVLEHAMGHRTAYDAIAERYLRPLGLTGTIPSISTRLPRLATGYAAANDPLGLSGAMVVDGALRMNPAFEWAGGGFASTPTDLARWAHALYGGRVVPAPQLAAALEGVPARVLGAGARYGLGVIIRDSPRGVTYGHSGFFPGYLTEMRYYADHGLSVAVQASTSDQRAIGRGLAGIAHELAERVLSALAGA